MSRAQVTRAHNVFQRVFDWSLYIKGVDGFLELVGGLLFWFVPPQAVGYAVRVLTAHELSEDPQDLLFTALRKTTAAWVNHPGHFASAYLIAHGVVKLFLVVNVLRERLWAFPPAIVFLIAFIGYQVYRYQHTHAVALLFFAAVDVFVTVIVAREYWLLRRRSL